MQHWAPLKLSVGADSDTASIRLSAASEWSMPDWSVPIVTSGREGGAGGGGAIAPSSADPDRNHSTESRGAQIHSDDEPCVDAWAVAFPREQNDWHGRSCKHKKRWGQCSSFWRVCAHTCGMCHNVSSPLSLPSVIYKSPTVVKF